MAKKDKSKKKQEKKICRSSKDKKALEWGAVC